MNQTPTETDINEAGADVERASQEVARCRAHLEELRAGRPALVAACASDPTRRPELRALAAKVLEAEDDVAIAEEAERQADAVLAELARRKLRTELAELRDGANGAHLAAVRDYIAWVRKTEAEACRRYVALSRACDEQARRVTREVELCGVLDETPTLTAVDADAVRLAANVAIARTRGEEERAHVRIEDMFAALDAPWIYAGTPLTKVPHPVLAMLPRPDKAPERFENASRLLSTVIDQ